MKNLELAIEKGEIAAFLMGTGMYAFRGFSDYDEPVDFSYCWTTEILPYSTKVDSRDLGTMLQGGFLEILALEEDKNLGLYVVLGHCLQYCFSRHAKQP